MQIRSMPFRWLGLVLTVLASALAGAEEAGSGGVRIAQAAEPDAAAEEQAAETAPASSVEEIIVKGAESATLMDFAKGDSVTAFNVADLAALGAQSIEDLASFTPNLEIVTAGATTPTFFIRGVGLNDFNPNSTGAVAIYQDDVAINAPAIQLGTLFDVGGVNVLRGPQGTGIARNASAGAIKTYSRKPSGQFGGFLRSELGNYDFQDYEGAVEAPIFRDILSGRLAFRLSQRDGTMKNRCGDALPLGQRQASPPLAATPPGTSQTQGPWSQCNEPVLPNMISRVPFGLEDYVNDTDNWAARGTLLFEPTLDTSFLVNGHGSRRDELTRLGQSIGTSGSFCTDPNKLCTGPTRDFTTRPPRDLEAEGLFDRNLVTAGLLGGAQRLGRTINDGYQSPEIRARWAELAPCLAATDSSTACDFQSTETRLAANRALVQVAGELAESLDSHPWEGDFNFTGPTTNDTWGSYLKSEIILPAALELKTTTAYDTYDRLIAQDLDFSPETLFHITTDDEAYQIYQDLALAGELGEALDLRWEVGGWYLRENLDVVVSNDFGDTAAASFGVTRRDFSQDTDSAAGYASFAFDFWEDFTLDGGYRYNWEEKDFKMRITGGLRTLPAGCSSVGVGISDCEINEVWQASTGTLRLLYRFREDTHVSWRYTRGWKPGSINATASQLSGPTIAEPEEIDAFEFGLHGSWFDGLFGMDASLFYYAYTQYQIFIARQLFGASPEFVLLNANDAEVYGSEIDAVVRPWVGAFVNVRFSWLETQFLDFLRRDQFLKAGGDSPVQFRDTQASGNPLLNSPHFKVSITAEQGVPIGRYGSLALRYDGVWTDTTYYDASKGRGIGDDKGNFFLPDDTIAQGPLWLHNLRLSWRAPDGRLEVAGWVRNLEDTAYKTFAFDGSNFQGTTIYFVGDPRTYGVSFRVDF